MDTITDSRKVELEALAKPSTTPEERKRRAKAAWQHIFDLCKGRCEWRMCIPPDPDDSDILLGAALHDLDSLVEVQGVPMAKPAVVCLCGSTRFSQAFRDANLHETLAGRIVLTIGCDMRSDVELFADKSEDELAVIKASLDELHLRKIDMSDEVLILNVDGYVGQSTERELKYAQSLGKTIRFLEPVTP